MVSIKDVVRSSVKVPEFDKHLKMAGGNIGRNVVGITIKMKTIVRKTLRIKIDKFLFKYITTSTKEVCHSHLSYLGIHLIQLPLRLEL